MPSFSFAKFSGRPAARRSSWRSHQARNHRVAADFDVGEAAFDELDGDDAALDILIREDRAGGNVAGLDVVFREGDARLLQLFRRDVAAGVGRDDFPQLAIGEDVIAFEDEALDRDAHGRGERESRGLEQRRQHRLHRFHRELQAVARGVGRRG